MTTIPLAYCAAPYAGDEAENFRRAGFRSDGHSEGGLVALVKSAGSRWPDPAPPRWAGVDARWDTRQRRLF